MTTTRPPRPRPPAYFAVAGIALDREMDRLRALEVFADGPLAAARPELKVRRASKRPNRLGFAVPAEFRLQVTAYPGIRPGDVLETLLHELTHLHVGRAAEPHAWHGRTFKLTLAAAMREAYGIEIPIPRATLHGPYADAIEQRRRLADAAVRARAAKARGDDDAASEEWRRYRLIEDANRDPDELLTEGIALSVMALELAAEADDRT